MTKNSVVLCISGTIHHMIIIYGIYVSNDNISRHFFHIFKIFIFDVVRRVKGQKMVQNEKKLCPSCSIFQEPYIVWLSFMVHICKMIMSLYFFSFLQNFDFLGHEWVKVQKMVQNDKKFCLLCSISEEPYITWLSFMVHMCQMIMSPGIFSCLQSFDFLGC